MILSIKRTHSQNLILLVISFTRSSHKNKNDNEENDKVIEIGCLRASTRSLRFLLGEGGEDEVRIDQPFNNPFPVS